MDYQKECLRAKLLKRYKRFLADVELNSGEVITVHVANTGSMKSCIGENYECLISHSNNPDRKLAYSLELTHNGESWINVNTALPNHVVHEWIESNQIPEIANYPKLQREVKIGKSRIDLLASSHPHLPDCYIEIKSVTMRDDQNGKRWAKFPDAISERGQKHLQELMEIVNSGKRAVIFFCIGREDVDYFTPAKEIDPTYTSLLSQAKAAGVEILAYQCKIETTGIYFKQKIEVKL
jgi:sugar fermentation stimulation protein A